MSASNSHAAILERVRRRLADEVETPNPQRLAALIREEAVVVRSATWTS